MRKSILLEMCTSFQGHQKGSTYYHGGDYLYLKSIETGDTAYLKCQDKSCPAKAEVRDRQCIARITHNHTAPTIQKMEDMRRLERVKDETERTPEGPGCTQLYENAVTWAETSSLGRAEALRRRCSALASLRQRRICQLKAETQ